MAKRKHDQKPDKRLMVCVNCKEGKCEGCVDRLRAFYTTERLCKCERKLHNEKCEGEPTLNQVKDPETGTVHAPGLTVDRDGRVEYRDGANPFLHGPTS